MLGSQKWGCLTEPSGAEWGPLHEPASKANECDVIQNKCASKAASLQGEHYLPACYLPYLFSTKTLLLQTLIPEKCVFSQKLLDSFSFQCLITKLFLN